MKRSIVAALGFVWGLLIVWLVLYSLSRIHWPPTTNVPSSGCTDMEHCSPRWLTSLTLGCTFLLPALFFLMLNAMAWMRWTGRKWVTAFATLNVLVALFFLFGSIVVFMK
jgi:hypothetical protein